MDSATIRSFGEFVKKIEQNNTENFLFLYRGQSRKRSLLPKIARNDPSIDSTEHEKKNLAELRRMGASFLNISHNEDWELLVVAQHYGLSTRLLDWTSNPLAALWFACSSSRKSDGYVYVLNATDLIIPPDSGKGPFDQSKTRVFQPRPNNDRIVAQHGWFTAHRYSNKAKCFVSLENNKDVKNHISEIIIPEKNRSSLLKSLDRHGTNHRTLFPDLEGLCKHLSWKSAAD